MWERALRMLGTRQLDLTPILGGTFPVEQWQTAFEKMHSGEFIKSVIKPA
jgi:alcohol dehydrogenase/L-iditol 2-dehydrogenase